MNDAIISRDSIRRWKKWTLTAWSWCHCKRTRNNFSLERILFNSVLFLLTLKFIYIATAVMSEERLRLHDTYFCHMSFDLLLTVAVKSHYPVKMRYLIFLHKIDFNFERVFHLLATAMIRESQSSVEATYFHDRWLMIKLHHYNSYIPRMMIREWSAIYSWWWCNGSSWLPASSIFIFSSIRILPSIGRCDLWDHNNTTLTS